MIDSSISIKRNERRRKSILWHINGIIRSDVQKGIKEEEKKKELNGPNFPILPLLPPPFWQWPGDLIDQGDWSGTGWIFLSFLLLVCVHGTNHSDGNSRQIFAWAGMRRWWNTIQDGLACCVWTHTIGNLFAHPPQSLSRLFFRVTLVWKIRLSPRLRTYSQNSRGVYF